MRPDVLPTTVISTRSRRADTSTPAPQASSSSYRTPAIVSPPPAQAIVDEPDTRSPATAALPLSLSPPPTGEFVAHTENTRKNIKRKMARMNKANNRAGFIEIESSLNRTIVWYFRKNADNAVSYRAFLNSIEAELITKLREHTCINPIKYNLKLEATYVIPNLHNSAQNRAFKTSARELYAHSNVEGLVDRDFSTLLAEEDCYAGKYSGFSLSSIDGLLLGVYEYTPMGGSSYLSLPESILNRKAVINPQNIDRQCFKWAILAKHVTRDHVRVGVNYSREEHRYDFSALSTPTPVSEIKVFEEMNPGTTVNVYGIRNCDKKNNKKKKSSTQSVAYPLRIVDEEKENHFDLLLITGKDDKNHYAFISNFSRLASSQKNNHQHRLFYCKRCFASFEDRPLQYKLHGERALAKHRLLCGAHKPVVPLMPKEGDTLKFEAWCKTERLPFVVYADFEALLLKTGRKQGTNTAAIHEHHPMSYAYHVVAAEGVPTELFDQFDIPRAPVIFRGSATEDDVAKRFVRDVLGVADKIARLYKEVNVPIIMSVEDCRVHEAQTMCDLCSCAFSEQNCKTAHHDHLSGRFLKTLCNTCNLKLKTPKFVPCFLHNLSNYDAHFIVTNLANDDNNRISVIANTEEKYISFSKYINNSFSVRFIDTCRFMASSLAHLAENLSSANFDKFREVAKVFAPSEMSLVTRKGVYPYEYTDSWDKLQVPSLPDKFQFYSALTETHVCDEDYDHATRVWNHFGCTTLGAYSDLYLKVDVLLSADVFENFRDICMATYHLDPAHYYTSPGFSFDCMLHFTKVQLELLIDFEKVLFLESGTRGGLVQASKRHARANNPETPGYNAEEPNTSLIYLDANNLYGYAMCQYMPIGDFVWYSGNPEVALAQLEWMRATDDIGRFYEVDIIYSQDLHDVQNDLPFLPHSSIPHGSTVRKLMATFQRKEHYVVHYMNLKQAMAHGVVVEKTHRVLEFRQSPWLAPYINLNTELRKQAKNKFEEKFFKDLNNSVYGKTFENMRLRFNLELVSCPVRMRKLINRPTFKYCTTYNENLSVVTQHTKEVDFCKPIYIGFAVLELSKVVMYGFHYDVMKRHYGDKIELLYTDTDSLFYRVTTNDFFVDLMKNPNLMRFMDTSNFPHDHMCYTTARKRIPGCFKFECGSRTVYEFVALRAKSYAYDVEEEITIRAKGVMGHVIRNHLTFAEHKRCLFADVDDDAESDECDNEFDASMGKMIAADSALKAVAQIHRNASTSATNSPSTTHPSHVYSYMPFTPYRENVSIRSFKHELRTIRTMKLVLNRADDKRHVLPDNISTYAHGHHRINF
ncbi:uncharacterized protein LOC100569006 [Acyrthosiphon pisum]|uniref:DNA-directed DNA polymerase n=1 Tax=Acyrthosiphon pisum TaxID=7029 RepID=A0A8R1W7M8_ACYPI|nr:uncharacterized protein LOC100569006 [Acyrthosiphon pisum]|eukprot:XP_003243221.1 PREDICTED: uncharacterized protein LOC100569006 [Acyrthosiphon pisum]